MSELHEFNQQRAMLVIWDGLPAHRSRRVSDWVTSHRDWLKVEPLPGYAPDLNPVEQVWGNLKGQELANLCSDSIEQLASEAELELNRITSDAPLCHASSSTPGCIYDGAAPVIPRCSLSAADRQVKPSSG